MGGKSREVKASGEVKRFGAKLRVFWKLRVSKVKSYLETYCLFSVC